jgi:hypothetical protein
VSKLIIKELHNKRLILLASYADISIVCYLQLFKRVDEKNIFDRILGFDPAIRTLYEACEKWVQKDD